jgi:Uma2 family endonuclease
MSAIASPPMHTIEDLERCEGKAELIAGRIVKFMPTGFRPNRVAAYIYRLLDDVAREIGEGWALTDNAGYRVRQLSSGRESFSPDASYYCGPLPRNAMKFIPGPPTLAVEVRSENDYGESAEIEMKGKRADYFEAGTLVVWDVDLDANCIRVYRASAPLVPEVYSTGDQVNAKPVLPGWSVPVDDILNQ